MQNFSDRHLHDVFVGRDDAIADCHQPFHGNLRLRNRRCDVDEIALARDEIKRLLVGGLALVDDALGRPQQARRHYDRLGRSVWSDLVALPSAANLAALGRYRDADRAFAQIASKGANADEKAYAQLWRLWLVTRDNASSRRARDTAFKRLLAAVRPDDAAQHALVELYRGKADSASVFAAIDRMPLTLPQRRALIAEATLFAGGYLQGMRNDAAAARWLYQVELGLPPVACPERPLIAQAARALPPLPTSNAR